MNPEVVRIGIEVDQGSVFEWGLITLEITLEVERQYDAHRQDSYH
jgi:hypothetical protein